MINLQKKSPKLLVIGDLMIDQYLWGSCERISPEAPVQVINVAHESTVSVSYTHLTLPTSDLV